MTFAWPDDGSQEILDTKDSTMRIVRVVYNRNLIFKCIDHN